MSGRPPEAERLAQRWLALAAEHLTIAEHAFSLATSSPYRLIAFHAQQAAEASLKALLVHLAIDFPFTHDIARLLELAHLRARWGAELAEADELTPYAVSVRYDLVDEPVSEGEARRAVELATRVVETVRRTLR